MIPERTRLPNRVEEGVEDAVELTLAIGIGGSTAIFTTVDPTLFESLPYPASDRLVFVCDRGQDGACVDVTFHRDRYVALPTPLLPRLRDYWRTHRSPEWLFPAPTRRGLQHGDEHT